jgi:hypothetical protein
MFSKITPRNNEWNRKYNISDENGYGFLMDQRNGLCFFAWVFPGDEARFYKCEEGVFQKCFGASDETVEYEMDPFTNVSFSRFPMEGF